MPANYKEKNKEGKKLESEVISRLNKGNFPTLREGENGLEIEDYKEKLPFRVIMPGMQNRAGQLMSEYGLKGKMFVFDPYTRSEAVKRVVMFFRKKDGTPQYDDFVAVYVPHSLDLEKRSIGEIAWFLENSLMQTEMVVERENGSGPQRRVLVVDQSTLDLWQTVQEGLHYFLESSDGYEEVVVEHEVSEFEFCLTPEQVERRRNAQRWYLYRFIDHMEVLDPSIGLLDMGKGDDPTQLLKSIGTMSRRKGMSSFLLVNMATVLDVDDYGAVGDWVRQRDKGVCQACLMEAKGEVHHIIPRGAAYTIAWMILINHPELRSGKNEVSMRELTEELFRASQDAPKYVSENIDKLRLNAAEAREVFVSNAHRIKMMANNPLQMAHLCRSCHSMIHMDREFQGQMWAIYHMWKRGELTEFLNTGKSEERINELVDLIINKELVEEVEQRSFSDFRVFRSLVLGGYWWREFDQLLKERAYLSTIEAHKNGKKIPNVGLSNREKRNLVFMSDYYKMGKNGTDLG